MSPSRIPRPGQSPGLGSESRIPAPRSAPVSPGIGTPISGTNLKSTNPFMRLPQQSQFSNNNKISNNNSSPTQTNQQGRIPPPTNFKRRPKPPIADEELPSTLSSPQVKRSAPTDHPFTAQAQYMQNPKVSPVAQANGQPRSCLRQPSTPLFTKIDRKAITDPPKNGRQRAATSVNESSRPVIPLLPQATLTVSQSRSTLYEAPPAVPPHIRTRLRLIHHLGVLLSMDATGVSSKIDVPALLAKVDLAYERARQAESGSQAQASSLPLGSGLNAESILAPPMKPTKSAGMMGIIKRLGRKTAHEIVDAPATFVSTDPHDGPAFGVPLSEAPVGSWCTSLIGGQRHELPLIVFTVVEEIYRRGMSQPGIFRLAGDGARISHLTKVFNLPPLYGDSLSISAEPIHNLTGLVKRYVRDLPEPILDESLFRAFHSFCAEPDQGALVLPLTTRIAAAQTLLRLLPSLHFSLFIYLLAFLGQLPLFPENRLNVESISIIFGPAMCAARGKGISGLGPSTAGRGIEHDPEEVSNLVSQSQSVLGWLLRNWSAISEKVLDPTLDSELEIDGERIEIKTEMNPKLLSPIDLRQSETPFSRPDGVTQSRSSSGTESTATIATEHGELSSSNSGIFRRALSNISTSSDEKSDDKLAKIPKRSASFSSLSSLMKKGQEVFTGKAERNSTEMNRPISFDGITKSPPPPTLVNPQITNVLGSLHDLLVSKDKQIERDAKELALLRHALLELDDKLSHNCICPVHNTTAPPTPAITITSTPSTSALAVAKDKDISDLQTQLTTALAALESARIQSKGQQNRILELEAKLGKADSERQLEIGKLEVALALEEAKMLGVMEERDIARERLEMVKTTLFSVT